MSVIITNTRFIQPIIQALDVEFPILKASAPRKAKVSYINVNSKDPNFKPVYGVFMDSLPYNDAWVEVWLDGFRMVNSTLDFGKTFRAFTIQGRLILFSEPIMDGLIKIYADGPHNYEMPDYLIKVPNIQGAKAINTVNGQTLAGIFCEPMVLTEPRFGFVRLTDDRQNLIYVPPVGWKGFDSFSYILMSDRGQASDPKCVFITVGKGSSDEGEE